MSCPTGKGVLVRANTYKTTFPADEENLLLQRLFMFYFVRVSKKYLKADVMSSDRVSFSPSVQTNGFPNVL